MRTRSPMNSLPMPVSSRGKPSNEAAVRSASSPVCTLTSPKDTLLGQEVTESTGLRPPHICWQPISSSPFGAACLYIKTF